MRGLAIRWRSGATGKSSGYPRSSSSDGDRGNGDRRMDLWRAVRRYPIAFATLTLAGFMLIVPLAISKLNDRGCDFCESTALINIRALKESLERYRSTNRSYPDAWFDDLYTTANPVLGPSSFAADIQTKTQTIQGYVFRYAPQPPGCGGTTCRGYTLTAVPHPPRMWLWMVGYVYGTRSFFLDQTGIYRHCAGGTGADATDPTIDQAPKPC